ncbi:MAG: hypothetical protein AAGA48_00430 [Myxococcota bacterium]
MKADSDLIKILLENQGEDSETTWAEDLGPVGTEGARRVRLCNVPFLHSRPTHSDELIVAPGIDGMLTWDRAGVPWERIDERIERDGGKYAMIVDYAPHEGVDSAEVFAGLDQAATSHQAVAEGCYGPRGERPGRIYLAVPEERPVEAMMEALTAAKVQARLILVHPLDEP